MRRRASMGLKLAVAFALVAASTAVLAAVIVLVSWQHEFRSYVLQRLQDRADVAASAMAEEYAASGDWSRVRFTQLAYFGMMNDLDIRVLDANGALIAYTADHPGQMNTGRSLRAKLASVTARAAVTVKGKQVGEILVASTAPGGLLSDRDVQFERATVTALAIAALLSVIAASVGGVLYARSIVRPVNAVTRVAARLRGGEADARTGMQGSDAVSQLGETLDSMAATIQAERAAERQLTADVAHELRTPLQAIQATVEAMQDGVLPVDEQRLGILHDETVRLGRLTGSILELSQLERRSARFDMQPIDPADAVAQAVEGSRALMEARSLALGSRLERGSRVLGDPDRLVQALGNLLSNAARYTAEGGSVDVTLRREGDDALIEVRDTGMGMSEQELAQAFTRFWRADPARARASGGLGIGLSVVREIVERHGGTVAIDSTPGEGTTVRIALPIAEEA